MSDDPARDGRLPARPPQTGAMRLGHDPRWRDGIYTSDQPDALRDGLYRGFHAHRQPKKESPDAS